FVLHSITQEKSPGLMGVARSIGANPTIIASAVGLVLSLAGVQLPEVVLEPVRSLADMAIPAMLLAYGLSLYGSKPLAKDARHRPRRRSAAGAARTVAVRGGGDGGPAHGAERLRGGRALPGGREPGT